MKRFLAFSLLLAAVSFPTHAQEGAAPGADRKVEVKDPVEINAQDRAEVAKGVQQVGRGMQGFFQALNSAVAQAHRDRASDKSRKATRPAIKDVDKSSSPR